MARLIAIALVFLLTLGVAWASERSTGDSAPRPAAALATGSMSQSNSRAGEAILTASAMRPGQSLGGAVSIANDGDLAGAFTLSGAQVVDTPGPNGGKLSDRLQLLVEDVTRVESPATVYSGKLATMPRQELGTFRPGEVRSYRFAVTFPDGGAPASETTGDNAYEGSRMSMAFDWDGIANDPGAPETPPGDQPPAPTPDTPPADQTPPSDQRPPSDQSPTRGPAPPGSGAPPATPVPDTTAPSVRLSGPLRQRVLRQRGVLVYARSSESGALRLAGRAWKKAAPRRGTSMTPVRRSTTAGARVRVHLRLSKKAQKAVRRALARRRPMVVTVTATATDAAGNSTTVKRNVRVRR